jgi:hypothetical protein
MPDDRDRYEIYYADKLWNLLPAVYRSEDTDAYGTNGPLREMVNRIGAQAAILRRSIDRLWEDQSIETCDDWVIPYIADLLATNLVASLDARGQRLDVAKTIYYRRRKGTVALLEELAADITGWDARVVEFFRRLGRTRHNFDPPVGTATETTVPATQLAATGDGTTTVFSFSLANYPVQPGTVQVLVAGLPTGNDNSAGAITGVGLNGTVDYSSGAIALTFAVAPAAAASISAQYEYLSYDLTLQFAEGLIGSLTRTDIGGWADLRNVFGASKSQTAFDEYFHTADFRKGRGKSGWYNIPKLGVFLWRLQSFGVDFTTPVADSNCPNYYAFDPTGRELPLFAVSSRVYGDTWVSPEEWQLPTPISTLLLQSALANAAAKSLYAGTAPDGTLLPNALGVFTQPGSLYELVDASQVTTYPESPGTSHQIMIFPEIGKLKVLHPPLNGPIFVRYHYGFSSTIGAGPYDRRIIGQVSNSTPAPMNNVTGGDNALAVPLAAVAPGGTVSINDSLTYTSLSDVLGVDQVTILAENASRPLIRLAPPSPNVTVWTLTGNDGSALVLEGLFVSGGDVVLSGKFDSVTLTCCTFDSGTSGKFPAAYDKAVDGRDLIPSHLWVDAEVQQLTIDRCILGPVQTRLGGEIQTLTVTDSIIQALGADQALNLISGQAQLTRCTVLGPAAVHRLYSSDCILDDVMLVDNTQDGCVRFTAWATGSVLPRQYESVEVDPASPLFVSRAFGRPGYAQLLPSVDNAIVFGSTSAAGVTISAGAEDGSEMGAFAREKNPIKQRSLLIKYQEFMPLGLVPVLIDVT